MRYDSETGKAAAEKRWANERERKSEELKAYANVTDEELQNIASAHAFGNDAVNHKQAYLALQILQLRLKHEVKDTITTDDTIKRGLLG